MSPDSRRIISASDDRTIKVWEADSGRLLRTLEGHAGPVYAVALTPEGRRGGASCAVIGGIANQLSFITEGPTCAFAISASPLLFCLLLCWYMQPLLQSGPGGLVIVIQATQPGGNAADCADAECTNGPVAKAIATAISDAWITVAQLFDKVNSDVAATTSGRQIPSIWASAAINVRLVGMHSVALSIGNGAYAHVPPLKGAPRDARLVGDALGKIGFQTKTLIDSNRRTMEAALNDFFQGLSTDDTAVLYYSGHGFSVNGVDYLPSLDTGEVAKEDAFIEASFPVNKLIDGFAQSKALRKILILDTHYPPLGADVRTPNNSLGK